MRFWGRTIWNIIGSAFIGVACAAVLLTGGSAAAGAQPLEAA